MHRGRPVLGWGRLATAAFLAVQIWTHATASDTDPGLVTVETARQTYRPGEAVPVTIHNNLSESIRGPMGLANCSIVTVERWKSGAWTQAGHCPADADSIETVVIPPGGRLTGQWGTSQDPGFVVGPIVQSSSAPRTQTGREDARPSAPRDEQRPIVELPEGGQARAEAHRPPFTDLPGRIDVGSYRLAFSFKVETGPTETIVAHSEVIVIAE